VVAEGEHIIYVSRPRVFPNCLYSVIIMLKHIDIGLIRIYISKSRLIRHVRGEGTPECLLTIVNQPIKTVRGYPYFDLFKFYLIT